MAQPRSTATTNPGVYPGTVTRVDGAAAYVVLPAMADGLEYGPARYPDLYAPAAVTGDTAAGGDNHHHTTTAAPLAPGDPVAVAFVAGRRDDVVILTRLA